MNDEIKEILDYFQKDIYKYEESKKYLMEKYEFKTSLIKDLKDILKEVSE